MPAFVDAHVHKTNKCLVSEQPVCQNLLSLPAVCCNHCLCKLA